MVGIQSPTAEIRRGKKRKKKKIEITGQKYNGLPYYIPGKATIKCFTDVKIFQLLRDKGLQTFYWHLPLEPTRGLPSTRVPTFNPSSKNLSHPALCIILEFLIGGAS